MTTRKPFFIMPMYRGQNNKNRQQLIANKKKFIEQQIKNNVTRKLYSQSHSYTTFCSNYAYIPNDNNNNNNNNNQNPKKPSNFWIMIASIVGGYLSIRKNK